MNEYYHFLSPFLFVDTSVNAICFCLKHAMLEMFPFLQIFHPPRQKMFQSANGIKNCHWQMPSSIINLVINQLKWIARKPDKPGANQLHTTKTLGIRETWLLFLPLPQTFPSKSEAFAVTQKIFKKMQPDES